MKKVILSAFMLLGLAFSAQAQNISKNTLGLRLGDNDGFGGEVSYQRGLGDNNRLELDLGWRNSNDVDAIKLAGLYQWVWNIDGGFNWYAGVGGGAGSWSYDAPAGYDGDDSGAVLFAAGDVGIEYNFDFPLQLSLDVRPEIDWRDDNFGPDIALGIRYKFD
jgi:hypothetical protein